LSVIARTGDLRAIEKIHTHLGRKDAWQATRRLRPSRVPLEASSFACANVLADTWWEETPATNALRRRSLRSRDPIHR